MNKNVCVMCGDAAVTTANHIPVCDAHYEAYRKEAELYPTDRPFYHALVMAYSEALKQDADRAALAEPPAPEPHTTIRARITMTEGKPTASRDICEDVIARADAAEERAQAAERKLDALVVRYAALQEAASKMHRAMHYEDIDGSRRCKECNRPAPDPMVDDWITHEDGCVVGKLRDALAALDTEENHD